MIVLKSVQNIFETSNKKAANTITSSVIKYLNEKNLIHSGKVKEKKENQKKEKQ